MKLKTFNNRIEAELAMQFLQSHGIEAWIKADDMGGLHPALLMYSGVPLFVPEADSENAKKLLASTALSVVSKD